MQPNLKRTPLLLPAVFLIAGIIFYTFLHLPWWTLILVFVFAAGLFFVGRTAIATYAVSFLLGMTVSYFATPAVPEIFYNNTNAIFRGKVIKVTETDIGDRYIVELQGGNIDGKPIKAHNSKVIINTFEFLTDVKPYDIITFRGDLKRTKYDPDLPGDPDYTNYYRYNSIVATCFVEPDNFRILGHDSSFKSWVQKLREATSLKLEESGISHECYRLLDAILLGDADSVQDDEQELFANSGLAHLLALSGTHVAIISSFIFVLLLPFRALGLRTGVYLACLMILWFYAMMTGLSSSVVRATIMISVLFLSRITSRSPNNINALCFAAILILVFSPMALFSPSFQLSFCAVGAILLFSDLSKQYRMDNKITGYFTGLIFVSIAALLGTALLSAHYFHKFPVYSILANIPAALLLPVFIVAGIFLIITGFMGVRWVLLADITDLLYDGLNSIVHFFAELPHSTIDNIYLSLWAVAAFTAFFLFLGYYLKTKRKVYGLYSEVVFLAFIISILPFRNDMKNISYYVTGNNKSSEIVIVKGNDVYFHTTHLSGDIEMVGRMLKRKHPDFINIMDCNDYIHIDSPSCPLQIRRNGRLLEIGGKTLAIISSPDDIFRPLPGNRADYALLTQTFANGDASKVHEYLHADTILLPKELHIKYAERLEKEFKNKGIPFFNLRNTKLWRTIE